MVSSSMSAGVGMSGSAVVSSGEMSSSVGMSGSVGGERRWEGERQCLGYLIVRLCDRFLTLSRKVT